MIIKNVKLNDKEEINKFLTTVIPTQHNLVKEGTSTYDGYNHVNEEAMSSIINTFKNMTDNKYEVIDMWCNIYKKGGHVIPHNHLSDITKDSKWLAGIYNFKKPKDSGDLYLNDKKVELVEDDFILFEIDDKHYTTKNLVDDIRIVFSVNMKEKQNA